MDAPQVGGLGGTYAGNPLACAAALATIGLYESDDLVGRAREIGQVITARLAAIDDPRIGEVRGRGAMMALEMIDPTTGEPDAALAGRVLASAHAQGVLLLGCGTYGNVIRLLPPLVISDALLLDGLQVIADALAAS
jgi:4-aminobutyrate aminotransferase/(S)-3-amino-2-methylpropionate transaminase